MRFKIGVAVFLALSVLAVGTAHAVLFKVQFDVRTHRDYVNNTTLTDFMAFWVEVYDTEFKNPPSFVDSIVVTAPDGTVFPLNSVDHWTYLDKGYYAQFQKSAFTSGTFPAGTYKVVVQADGVSIAANDVLDPVTFLRPVALSYPTEGATGVPEEATIKWGGVGASRYIIYLGCTSTNDPLFNNWPGMETMWTNRTSFKIPKGVLKPNKNYRLRIEARSNLQDTESRSRSKWINFQTGTW